MKKRTEVPVAIAFCGAIRPHGEPCDEPLGLDGDMLCHGREMDDGDQPWHWECRRCKDEREDAENTDEEVGPL